MLDLASAGILIVFFGIAIVLIATFLNAKRDGSARVQGGGVVMIGPIPIIFGSDAKWTSIAVALAIVLVILGLLYYVV
jgi:uncharacterized protein (TIGR00304 family)